MDRPDHSDSRSRKLVRVLDRNLDDAQRSAMLEWLRGLTVIRASSARPLRKAKQEIILTQQTNVLPALASAAAKPIWRLAWEDRSWPTRLGLGSALVTAATLGSEGAGIAALGGAIGVPLWVVLGGGGALAGVMIEELQRSLAGRGEPPAIESAADQEPIPEAEWEFAPELPSPEVKALPAPPRALAEAEPPADSDPSADAPLEEESPWQVFKRSYRAARARQRGGGEPPPA